MVALRGLPAQTSRFRSLSDYPTPKPPLLPCRLGKWAYLYRVYINLELLDIVSETTFVHASISPYIPSVAIFLVSFICADIDVSISLGRFPTALALPYTLFKLTFVAGSICPYIFPFSVELSVLILSFVLVSIYKHLATVALFDTLHKRSIIIFLIGKFEVTLAILFALLPLTAINNASGCV